MAVVDGSIQLGHQLAAWFTTNASLVLLDGQIVYCKDGANAGKYKIGDGSTALSALTFYGGVSSSGLTVGTTTITGGTNTRILYNNSGVVGEYDVTGSGTTAVLSTSPTFTTDIKTPIVYGSTSASGTLTLGSTSNATKGTIQIGTTDFVNVGNYASPTNLRILSFGQDTAYGSLGSLVGTTSSAALYLNQATPSGTNYILMADSSGNYYINGGMNGGNLSVRLNNNNIMSANTTAITWTPLAVSAGSPIPFQIQLPNSTGQTASTNSPAFKVTGNTKQWLAGALATQYFNYFSANTVAFASASTATNVYGLYVEAATAGTNATITNNYALGTNGNVIFDDGTSKMIWRAVPTVPSYSGIFLNETPSSTNPSMYGDGSGNTFVNGSASVYIARGTSNVARFGFHFALFTAQNNGAGSSIPFDIAPVSATNTTASTEVNTLRVGNSFTRTWATGAITTQRFIYFPTQTIAFGSASTVTTAYGLYVEAATAGTNATITNNYAAGFSGNINILSGELRNSGTKVVGTRDTGWTAFTNTTNKATAYDTATVTLQQLAERVAAMQAALTTHGLLGA